MMRALVKTGENEAEVRETEKPDSETVVRTLTVGIDGTDREVLEADSSRFPEGDQSMIMGHEAVGRVESSPDLEEGTPVVPTVRRPSGDCSAELETRPDYCPPGRYVERGINGAHGFCSEFFAESSDYLVEIPESIVDIGVLVEPESVVLKGIGRALKAREDVPSGPGRAAVLGAGAIGQLATMTLLERGLEVQAVDIVDRDSLKAELVREAGAEYVDGRETELEELHSPDIIVESSGVSRQVLEGARNLAPNGVLVSLGLPGEGKAETTTDLAELHRELVLKNKAVLGSVNSSVDHFSEAAKLLERMRESYPVGRIIDTHKDLESWEEAFDPGLKGQILFERS